MLVRVVDFETTGMPPGNAVCEVGWYDVLPGETATLDGYEASFCDPGRPMPPEARAIHHISDEMLVGAPPATSLFMKLMVGADAFCAHNAAFEREFFTGGDRPWICTLKVARRIWPECPSHSNQCLRYWLGLDLEDALAMPPHRAGPDTYVTGHILREALKVATVEQMIAWTDQPSLLPNVTFGKHKGQKWQDLPADYLTWIVHKSDMDEDTKFTAKHHLTTAQNERAYSRF